MTRKELLQKKINTYELRLKTAYVSKDWPQAVKFDLAVSMLTHFLNNNIMELDQIREKLHEVRQRYIEACDNKSYCACLFLDNEIYVLEDLYGSFHHYENQSSM